MKRSICFFVLPILLLLSAISLHAQTKQPKLQGTLINGTVVFNKIQFNPLWKLQTAKKVFGQPQRFNDGANKVHLYDSLGMIIYEGKKANQPTGVISEITIFFSIKESGFLTPSNLYNGTFAIENITITKNTKIEDVESTLISKGYKKKGEKWFVKNGTYVIFLYESDLLESISIGKA